MGELCGKRITDSFTNITQRVSRNLCIVPSSSDKDNHDHHVLIHFHLLQGDHLMRQVGIKILSRRYKQGNSGRRAGSLDRVNRIWVQTHQNQDKPDDGKEESKEDDKLEQQVQGEEGIVSAHLEIKELRLFKF